MEKLKKVLDVVKNVVLWILGLLQELLGYLLRALGSYLQKKPQDWNK